MIKFFWAEDKDFKKDFFNEDNFEMIHDFNLRKKKW